jgi:hypothetical protein
MLADIETGPQPFNLSYKHDDLCIYLKRDLGIFLFIGLLNGELFYYYTLNCQLKLLSSMSLR